jgi:hypothetical protein
MDLREYEQHKFAIADLLRQMALAAPDKQQWRDQATALFTRLAEDRFNLVLERNPIILYRPDNRRI